MTGERLGDIMIGIGLEVADAWIDSLLNGSGDSIQEPIGILNARTVDAARSDAPPLTLEKLRDIMDEFQAADWRPAYRPDIMRPLVINPRSLPFPITAIA